MPRPRRGRGGAARGAARAAAQPPSSSSPSIAGDQKTETRGRPRGRPRKNPLPAARPSISEEDAIQAANRTRDEALKKLANEDATTTSDETAPRASSRSSIELGRFTATTTPGRNRRDTSGLDLADSVFGDLEDSFAEGNIPGSARSGDTSNMSYSALRSQSRRSSFVGRNDPPIRPSSRTGNTPRVGSSFNIGLFKRRAREPSILGGSRIALQEEAPRAIEDSEADSEDDFEPEAESTPLNNRRRTQGKVDSEEPEVPDEADSSNPRKRKSLDTQQSRARPGKVSRTEPGPSRQPGERDSSELPDAPPFSQHDQVDGTSDSELSEMSLPRDLPARLPPRPVTPVNLEEIAAPPASSGSEGPEVWPDIRTLAKKRRRPSVTTPTRLENLSDMSSPPSLTHSPNYDTAKTSKPRGRPPQRQQQESPKMTTADLTSLLPKRKYKKSRDPLGLESDEELDTSGLGHEDDELSYLDTQTARRRKRGRPPTKARSASRGGKRTASSSARPTSYAARSRHSSDKENAEDDGSGSENEEVSRFDPLADDTFNEAAGGSADAISTEELKQASNKFKEVDKWELDFEEVAEPSSPQDGR